MAAYDLVLRRGTIVDGSGGEPFKGDVAVKDGRIAAVGMVDGAGAEEIDAAGAIVTPGFVDIHTHYDGQVTWEQRIEPSSCHGVTTAVMGNCGIGFAPCRPQDRDSLLKLMEGVEDLPEAVLSAGLPWSWQSFPDYLDFVASRRFDLDVAAQLPHAALRVFVMGERAVAREEATEEDRARMAAVASEAMAAGAIGFATSRTINHRASDGNLVYTLTAAEEELVAIGRALGDAGRGVLQIVSDFSDLDTDLPMLRRLAEQSGRPLSVSLMQLHTAPDRYRRILDWIAECNAAGLEVRGQVSGRPIGMMLGFELSYHPFSYTPTWKSLLGLPVAKRLERLRDPDVRAAITRETPDPADFMGADFIRSFGLMYPLGDPVDYEPAPGSDVAARAAALGKTPAEHAYDLMLEQDGRAVLMLPSVNFHGEKLDAAEEMLRHPNTVYGLGDGGAHLGFLCDASLPTYMLQHWTRDRSRGARLPLAEVVRGLTARPAEAVQLNDRGLIAPGRRADLNVIDLERLRLHAPRVRYDLPAGGRRLVQEADGYRATIVAGVTVRRDGRATGALPGRLVRGPQPEPAH
ncbi:N-acyl-D-amino-acid deacylase family protein [Sphingomonas jatrophae]|uniref:Dihydroorotase n=1 Tax=Sphingomonas jatrophae TaxID=1166337 RepID=A0A1I6M130_9SPHN|nr:amidohydrolase family protein [Sphingomonas jatrophae]SFS09419.1 dihydroorotase [Sphingomonas jatrophae]